MKTYNAALQAQLDAYLSEQSGLPQSKAAAMIGVSPTALSQYRNSKYPGDVEAVESKIEEFLRTRSAAAQAEAEKAPYLSAGYVPTSVSEDVYACPSCTNSFPALMRCGWALRSRAITDKITLPP